MNFSEEYDALEELNKGSQVIDLTRKILKNIYKYEGDSVYKKLLPF